MKCAETEESCWKVRLTNAAHDQRDEIPRLPLEHHKVAELGNRGEAKQSNEGIGSGLIRPILVEDEDDRTIDRRTKGRDRVGQVGRDARHAVVVGLGRHLLVGGCCNFGGGWTKVKLEGAEISEGRVYCLVLDRRDWSSYMCTSIQTLQVSFTLKSDHLNIFVESIQPHLHPSLRRIVAVRSTQASCCFQNYTLCIFAFYTNNMVIFRIAPDPTFTEHFAWRIESGRTRGMRKTLRYIVYARLASYYFGG